MPPRRYRVLHETAYSYGGEVVHSHQLLHLSPRDCPRQRCISRSIRLEPPSGLRAEHIDSFGNLVTRIEYDRPHSRLTVLAEIDVEVEPRERSSDPDTQDWEAVRARLRFTGRPVADADIDAMRFRMQSGYVRLKQAFDDFAADCFPAGAQILAGAKALMNKIHRQFSYVPGSTDISTSVDRVLQTKRGVCQDFAHFMIACLRSRGLAARYVSGYLRTNPAPGGGGAVGADASHAWVAVYCPPVGWIDLDPTNDVVTDTDHITVAWGRDFGDVSPLRGVIVGGGRHDLSVRVSVTPADAAAPTAL